MSYGFTQFRHDFFPSKPTYTEKDYPDLSGKTFLVTGTSAGVGKSTVGLLLGKGATVVTVNRNLDKNSKALDDVIHELVQKNSSVAEEALRARVINIQADLMDLTTLKPAAEEVKQKVKQLDTIILNAGIMHPPNGTLSAQGYEGQFATNVMGHQLLLDLLTPLIEKAVNPGFPPPRVVFLSSSGHYGSPPNGGMTWDFKNASKAMSQVIYGQSKAGNIYQSAIYAAEHPNIISVAVHPGVLVTDLARNWPSFLLFIFNYLVSPAIYGAYSVLFGALHPQFGLKDSGKTYIGPFGKIEAMRPDIEKGCTDGTAKKMVDWVEKEIAPYK